MKALVAVGIMGCLVLTGCASEPDTPDPHANDKCVKSHTVDNSYMMLIVIDANGTTTYMWVDDTETVCDKWVPKATRTDKNG